MSRLVIAFVCAASLLAAGCAGGTSDGLAGAVQTTSPTAQPTLSPVAIPFPVDDTPHGTSAIQQVSQLGKDAVDSGRLSADPASASFAQANGNDMQLVAYPGDSAYAVYKLNCGAFDVSAVHYQLQTGNGQKTWIGVADYDTLRWRWFSGDSHPTEADVTGFNHVSPQGNLHVAILVHDDATRTIEAAWINLDTPDWVIEPVSSLPRMGMVHGMAMVDGTPAVIAQQREVVTDNNLLYCYASTAFPAGPTDWTTTEVQAGIFDPMLALELIEQPGPRPGFAVVYSSNQLWYAYGASTQPAGSGDWNYSSIANVESEELSLAAVQNYAGILFETLGAGGGTKVEYAWAAAPLPTGADWHFWTVADSGNPSQNYGGLSLCAAQNDLPTAIYFDYLVSGLNCFSASQADITAANQTYTALVEDPPLGGGYNDVLSWQGLATMVYDQFWSVPRLARADVTHPAQPDDFSWHHDLWDRGMYSPALVDLGSTLGVAWHDINDNSVWFAYYDGQPGDAGGPADWKVVQVDSRPSSGDLCIVALPGDLPGISYFVDADTQLYFAATAALP